MLDLNKYLKRAEIDPGFRQRLLQNANQAIRDEFGEDLPYNVKCKVKLTFEIEPSYGLPEADLSDVAGGVKFGEDVRNYERPCYERSTANGTYYLTTGANNVDFTPHRYSFKTYQPYFPNLDLPKNAPGERFKCTRRNSEGLY